MTHRFALRPAPFALPLLLGLLASCNVDDAGARTDATDASDDAVGAGDVDDIGLADTDAALDADDVGIDFFLDLIESDDVADVGDSDADADDVVPVVVHVRGSVSFAQGAEDTPVPAANFVVTANGGRVALTDGDGVFDAVVLVGDALSVTAEVPDAVAVEDGRRGRVHAMPIAVVEGSGALDPVVLVGAAAAPLHIASVAVEGLVWLEAIDARPEETLSFRWSSGLAWPCGSCYAGETVLLGGSAADPDEWDDAIIIHELGHFVVEKVSADSSPGGQHRDRLVAPTLAWAEGFAYFYAAAVLGRSVLCDSFASSQRTMDLERMEVDGVVPDGLPGTTTGDLSGEMREELVSAVLFDAADPVSEEEDDDIALGFERVVALTLPWAGGNREADAGPDGIDLTDWLVAAVCDGVDGASLERLVARHGATWSAPPTEACATTPARPR